MQSVTEFSEASGEILHSSKLWHNSQEISIHQDSCLPMWMYFKPGRERCH
jgi:hypothetical protein